MCIIVSTNPVKRISFEDVKQCPEFSHLTDEQAREIAETINRFTEIVYNYSSSQFNETVEEGIIIEMPNEKIKAA